MTAQLILLPVALAMTVTFAPAAAGRVPPATGTVAQETSPPPDVVRVVLELHDRAFRVLSVLPVRGRPSELSDVLEAELMPELLDGRIWIYEFLVRDTAQSTVGFGLLLVPRQSAAETTDPSQRGRIIREVADLTPPYVARVAVALSPDLGDITLTRLEPVAGEPRKEWRRIELGTNTLVLEEPVR